VRDPHRHPGKNRGFPSATMDFKVAGTEKGITALRWT